MSNGFRLLRRVDRTQALVSVLPDPGGERLAVLCHPLDKAVVLGSTEAEADVDLELCRANDVEVVRRRSGGGSVYIDPNVVCWLDLFIPRHDPLFDDDVARAFMFPGAIWATALRKLGVEGVAQHGPMMQASPFSRRACFAGLGPGEVLISTKKAVGISQRRDRLGAWFFSIAYLVETTSCHVDLLTVAKEEKAVLRKELMSTTTPVAIAHDLLEKALVEELERGGVLDERSRAGL